jgi:hypothetical protein
MNLWAMQRDAAMDSEDVSRLVAMAFLKHANLDLRIADYRHLAAYFSGAIKHSYCTKFPIDETSGHSSTTAARQYANCSNDHRFMDSQQMYTYRLVAEALHRLGHGQWTCKEEGLAVMFVLENKFNLLVVMPTGHGKSAMFMIPLMVTACTVIVMVPLMILIRRHEANVT